MDDDQMTKLFKYMDDKFSVVDKRFDEMDHKFDQLQSAVDAYAKKADTYYQEMAAMDHKIRRLEKYIEALADKTGLDLNAVKIWTGMAIQPKCDKCNEELVEFGAILLSPPDEKNMVKKFHICKSCYSNIEQDLQAMSSWTRFRI